MTVLNLAASPRLIEAMNDIKQLTLAERLMLARLLLDSVLTSETDDDADWLNLGLAAFENEWNNSEDAIYDNWRALYGVPARCGESLFLQ